MYILGINAYHGDAAAAIIKDGTLIAAVEEERFNRFKHCAGFPEQSIRYCLEAAGIRLEDLDHVGISRDPSAHLHKKVLFAASRAARMAMGGGRGRGDAGTRRRGDGETRGHGDAETRGHGDAGTRGHGDAETRRRGDAGTRGNGDAGKRGRGEAETWGYGDGMAEIDETDVYENPNPEVSASPHLRVPASPRPPVPASPRPRVPASPCLPVPASSRPPVPASSRPPVPASPVPASPHLPMTASSGLFRQIKDRLGNAARVRELKDELARVFGVPVSNLRAQCHNIEHHRAHLASCFFVSPFERAALLSIDGFGDFISTMWAAGEGNSIAVLGQVEYPHSIGIVYTATTQFLGFPHYGDEGKVMGLAPYGRPRFINEFRDIVRTEENGQFRLNLDYFRHHAEGVDMTWDEGSPTIGRVFSDQFAHTFGLPRMPGEALSDRERDIAASLQLRLEEVGFHILNHLHEKTGLTDLGLAGGVAYNSVMNGKILLHTPFRRLFIQPAAGDSGTALGVCYQIYNGILKRKRGHVMTGAYAGPQFSNNRIQAALARSGLVFETFTDAEVTRRAARDIAAGLVVGWFQGRMEFGPRALGNRSIVVDPRRAEMREILNDRVKKREPFRPFAPSILEERVGDYFEQTHPAPTMLLVYQVKPERRAEIPAVTHVDGSGRLQTVSRELNERYYQLISDFAELTGVPVILNTSFNENEPIVCTPEEAIECFRKTRMDVLYMGNCAVRS